MVTNTSSSNSEIRYLQPVTVDKNRKKYYLLENNDKGKLKARLIIKEDTLIKWIEIVESVPKPKRRKAGK